ncbi:hypothetical protein GCM10009665_06850 [Kitasatospora nipponensis]|uniref:BNR/Asp-box repeat protein n=1 Tax=Kitasatospora nipponensis TaxID=258049 RepID=A0ABN1VQ42_9ACTN
MAKTTRSSSTGSHDNAVQERRAAVERARAWRRTWWAGAAVAVVAVAAGGAFFATRGSGSSATTAGSSAAAPEVGGDLHTVQAVGDALFVGGHAAVAVSHDGGHQWQQVPSLHGADAMGWASTPDAVLVGGHPGLYRSTDAGATFTKATGAGAVADVHALGGTGTTVYLASPKSGLMASTDGGRSWQVRNAQAGRTFMGTILVDPKDPARLITPDLSAALATSSDGGLTWKSLGGPVGAMAVAWNPSDTRQLIAVGMDGAQASSDGGATWRPIDLPKDTSALTYDASGRTLYAGVLEGQSARTFRSTDAGASWTPTA